MVKNFSLDRLSKGDQVRVDNVKNVLADHGELVFNLMAVLLDESNLRIVALVHLILLNRNDYSPGSTAMANHILVGYG